MPVQMSVMSAVYGAAYGLLPIGWIILNVMFLYQLTLEKGHFKILQNSIANVTEDRRLQLLLIAFAFGAFFEGAAGFGTPVAVAAAMLTRKARQNRTRRRNIEEASGSGSDPWICWKEVMG